jgi:hypothetical protein
MSFFVVVMGIWGAKKKKKKKKNIIASIKKITAYRIPT